MLFTATIKIINGNPFVTPPEKVLAHIFETAGKKAGPITVRGLLNDAEFQQGLVRYLGEWRLYINGVMAKDAGLKFSKSVVETVGQNVNIDLHFDDQPKTYPMIPEFKNMLDSDSVAKKN